MLLAGAAPPLLGLQSPCLGRRAPPTVEGDAPNTYHGYFENRYGEQWIFTFDRATREASLHGGDAGWARAHPVRDGRVDGLILAPEETAWLQACWSATRA